MLDLVDFVFVFFFIEIIGIIIIYIIEERWNMVSENKYENKFFVYFMLVF